jgi:hypothetical protein
VCVTRLISRICWIGPGEGGGMVDPEDTFRTFYRRRPALGRWLAATDGLETLHEH